MNNKILSLGFGLLGACLLASCGGNDNSAGKGSKLNNSGAAKSSAAAAAPAASAGSNFRFVNVDSISLKYNLAIDFNEQMIRLQNGLAEEEKRQQQAAQSKLSSLEKRAQAAQSLTDPEAARKELESIQTQAQNIQYDAQQKLADVASNSEKTIARNAQVLQDSITNFLRDYAQEMGYDAIIVNQAAPYYNPDLDITNEVVEGLNARYNKVKK